jgi:hypothetical protein
MIFTTETTKGTKEVMSRSVGALVLLRDLGVFRGGLN